jgi:hypothetical protein
VAEDIFETTLSAAAEKWDVITTDAFLTRFGAEDTKRVTSRWFDLLKPGGRLITTVRVHAKSPLARSPEDAVRDFADRARLRAERWRSFLGPSPEEIAGLAEVYARKMVSEDLGSEEDIEATLTSAGFDLHEARLAEVPGELHPTTYIEIVGRKPLS